MNNRIIVKCVAYLVGGKEGYGTKTITEVIEYENTEDFYTKYKKWQSEVFNFLMVTVENTDWNEIISIQFEKHSLHEYEKFLK